MLSLPGSVCCHCKDEAGLELDAAAHQYSAVYRCGDRLQHMRHTGAHEEVLSGICMCT